jgi:hypothetical protein
MLANKRSLHISVKNALKKQDWEFKERRKLSIALIIAELDRAFPPQNTNRTGRSTTRPIPDLSCYTLIPVEVKHLAVTLAPQPTPSPSRSRSPTPCLYP